MPAPQPHTRTRSTRPARTASGRPDATPGALRRSLPVLALGVAGLGLALPTALPASAAPGGPGTSTAPVASDGATAKETTAIGSTARLTTEAREAGVEFGNAPMGWRQRGTERAELAALDQPKSPLLRYGASAAARSSSTSSFVPKGVLGVDVSSYQRDIKWSTWTKKDRDFAYIKATEGTSYKNPYFKTQYNGATKAHLIRGAYHFASPSGKAGYLQARYFVKNGGGWSADGKTLPGVLDIEYNPYGKTCYGVSKKNMVKWISSFTKEYKKLTRKDAVIYTTTDWWTQCTGNSSAFAKTNPLWIARYGTTKPGTLPKGWKVATFWQYGVNPIDQDVFPSKPDRLKVLATKI